MTKNLATIEQTFATLWTNEGVRSQFLSGNRPDCVEEEMAAQIDPRGVRLYASLIRTGRQELMQSIYPGCQKVLSRQWTRLVDRYTETRPPVHYNFNQVAAAFSEFLKNDTPEITTRHPFLPELADYEWIELAIMESDKVAKRGENVALDNPEVFAAYGPILNPVLVVRHYQYPIAKLVDWLRDDVRLPRRIKKDATNLAIYRDPEDHSSRFLELGALAARIVEMVEMVEAKSVSYAELLTVAVSESKSGDPQETVMKVLELFEQLQELNVFLGSTKV